MEIAPCTARPVQESGRRSVKESEWVEVAMGALIAGCPDMSLMTHTELARAVHSLVRGVYYHEEDLGYALYTAVAAVILFRESQALQLAWRRHRRYR